MLAVLVKFPFASRPQVLPVLVDLYRSEQDDRARGRPHRAPAQLVCRLLRLVLMRFPGRRFVLVGDSAYGTHEAARFCRRHAPRLTLASKFRPDANLFAPPLPGQGEAAGQRGPAARAGRGGGGVPGEAGYGGVVRG